MRVLFFFSFVWLFVGCVTTQQTAVSTWPLNGVWVPVQQELGGKELPKAVFQTQKLSLLDSFYTLQAESMDKGVLTYGEGKMDITGTEGVNTGKHFTAIYKFENGRLTICYNLKGDSYPGSFTTQGNPLLFLSVFIKENSR